MATFRSTQLQNFSLSGAGAVIGDTSITLQSFADINGTLVTMADFGTIGYGTLEPGNGSLEEQISFSGVVQNTNGTATLTGVMSVAFVTPYTSTSGLSKTHAGSTSFVISNTSGFYNQFPAKVNDETITGQWTFTNTPIVPGTVSDASTTVKGVSKLSVAALLSTNPIVVGDNDTRLPQNAYGADSGTANVYAITLTPAPSAYTAGQLFVFKAAHTNTGISTLNVNSLGAKTIKMASGTDLTASTILVGQMVLVEYDGTNFQLMSDQGNAAVPLFGGTGADGALTATSGNTNVDCGAAQFVVKNYTSISITGTGSVTFTNPHANGTTIIVKSQGNVTLTSSTTPMLSALGMGSVGGAAVSTGTTSASTVPGNNGSIGYGFNPFPSNFGLGSTSSSIGTDGAVPTTFSLQSFIYNSMLSVYKYGLMLWLGAGAGAGSAYNNTGGTLVLTSGKGGRGGGCIILEVGGAYNFTTANGISVAGVAGDAAVGSGTTNGIACGGGGGAGGFFMAIYNVLTASSGTVNVNGGSTGANTVGTGSANKGGGGANAIGAGSSGVGANGLAFTTKNTEFY